MPERLLIVLAVVVGAGVLSAGCAQAPQRAPARTSVVAGHHAANRPVVVPADAPGPAIGGIVSAIPPPPAAPPTPERSDEERRASRSSTRSPHPAGVAAGGQAGAAPHVGDPAASVVAGVNAERTRRGLAELSPSGCATDYAQRWAQHLATTGEFRHQPLEPVMSSCGATRVAENIAGTSGSADEAVALWMASPGHRANLLSADLTHSGLASVQAGDGAWISVQVFVTL